MTLLARDVLLQVVKSLTLIVEGEHHIVARLGEKRIDCGPHGLAIVETFRTPCTLQSAATRLALDAASSTAWGEMMTVIGGLRLAGLIVPTAVAERGPHTVSGFAAAAEHVSMLDDSTRTHAFLRAIRETVKAGDVVVDLGTGTGVLAIAAAQAGARHVYAIEATSIANAAAAMLAAGGFGDRITLIRGWSTEVQLGERADVLISETLGHDPWAEGFLHLVGDAQRRWLQPSARIIPYRVRLIAQPVAVPESRRDALSFTVPAARRWTEDYGVDFSPLLSLRRAHLSVGTLRLEDVVSWPRPCPAAYIRTIDVGSPLEWADACRWQVVASEDGVIGGVLLCWEADLAPGISISTHPDATPPVSSWRVRLVLAPEVLHVRRGDPAIFTMTFDQGPRLEVAASLR